MMRNAPALCSVVVLAVGCGGSGDIRTNVANGGAAGSGGTGVDGAANATGARTGSGGSSRGGPTDASMGAGGDATALDGGDAQSADANRESGADATRPCQAGAVRCSSTGDPQRCGDGSWVNQTRCSPDTEICFRGACAPSPPSCDGLAPTCGASGTDNCCTTLPVSGGSFTRGYYSLAGFFNVPATVSDFVLDKYEITVGRFRKFIAAWDGGFRPSRGAGKHAHLNGGLGVIDTRGTVFESGWDDAWSAQLPGDAAAWELALTNTSPPNFGTWTSTAGSNESYPVDFMTWYAAYAFCIWDGGFLPSEAEWECAGAGGSEQRTYPWGSWDPPPDASLAAYGCFHGGPPCMDFHSMVPVGSLPAGDGRYGQSDLAGNVFEWTLDFWFGYTGSCVDCAAVSSAGYNTLLMRANHGGDFKAPAGQLMFDYRVGQYPEEPFVASGARCARSP